MPKRSSLSSRAWSLLLLLLATACYAQTAPSPAPALSDLPTDRWERVEPGGETVCADGSSYAFYARGGEENALVIDLQGGGACWDAATCSRPGEVYSPRVSPPPGSGGLYSQDRGDNPVAGWSHIFIPYCSGDVHWGDNRASYENPQEEGDFSVEHRGAVNARAALGWIFAQVEAPERILVTGCSAGAYGSILWTPLVREHYPHAGLYQLGDSGAGVVTESFVAASLSNWRVEEALPAWVPGLDPAEDDVFGADFVPRLYRTIGKAYPELSLAQYHTRFDGVQIGFYELMGGSPEAWSERMLRSLEAVESETENVSSYLAHYGTDARGATPHCILGRPEFYTLETGGVRFVDWLAALLEGERVPSVRPLE